MRGEHWRSPPACTSPRGSSPHARGAHHLVLDRLVNRGLIPACAGSTSSGPWWTPGGPAHPRMRGEHSSHAKISPRSPGSSPHARGARSLPHGEGYRARLIPACAGSTQDYDAAYMIDRAHPRMRGEHGTRLGRYAYLGGSSPHARGAHQRDPCTPVGGGLIPACAGSTLVCHGEGVGFAAHPRMRGEHPAWDGLNRDPRGSSPHARGAREPAGPRVHLNGLIPACAGSTGQSMSTPNAGGLIPACAGSTLGGYFDGDTTEAHPRMRGEHLSEKHMSCTTPGSSPHARGARRF